MRARTFSLVGTLLALAIAAPGTAQEGHPLKGSWIGEWADNETHDEFVLIVLDWDGRKISGMINPGTDNIEITEAELNPEDWSVHIVADTQDSDGRDVNYVIDGNIEDLELPSRHISGTWRNGDGRGDFRIQRQ